jgi:hypothetical protein
MDAILALVATLCPAWVLTILLVTVTTGFRRYNYGETVLILRAPLRTVNCPFALGVFIQGPADPLELS